MPAQTKVDTSGNFEERVNLLKLKLRLLNPMSHVGSQTMFHTDATWEVKLRLFMPFFGVVSKSQNWHHHVCRSVRPPSWKNWDPSVRLYMEVYI